MHTYTHTCICIIYMFTHIHMYLNKPIFEINYTYSEVMFENETKTNLKENKQQEIISSEDVAKCCRSIVSLPKFCKFTHIVIGCE